MKAHIGVPVFFHGHNDLGLAAANAFAAVRAGADGLDVTVNGLGDRAGNASLEQVAMILHLRGIRTGIRLETLTRLSGAVGRESGIAVSPLAPVVGAFVATHKSPGHLEIPELFEAFDPALVGVRRNIMAERAAPKRRALQPGAASGWQVQRRVELPLGLLYAPRAGPPGICGHRSSMASRRRNGRRSSPTR